MVHLLPRRESLPKLLNDAIAEEVPFADVPTLSVGSTASTVIPQDLALHTVKLLLTPPAPVLLVEEVAVEVEEVQRQIAVIPVS